MNKQELKDLIVYEAATNLDVFKKIDTWLWLLSIIALLLAIIREFIPMLIVLFIIGFLQVRKNYQSGEVQRYFREKAGIPSRGEIRRLKEKYKLEQEQKASQEVKKID